MSDEREKETTAEIESIEPEGMDKGFQTIRKTWITHNHQDRLVGIRQERVITKPEGIETVDETIFITEALFDILIDGLHKMNRHMANPDEEYGS